MGRREVRPSLIVNSNFELDHTGKQAAFSSLQTHSIEVPNGFLQVAVSKTIRPVCVATVLGLISPDRFRYSTKTSQDRSSTNPLPRIVDLYGQMESDYWPLHSTRMNFRVTA